LLKGIATGAARTATATAIAAIGRAIAVGGERVVAAGTGWAVGGELVAELFVELFEIPDAFLEIGALVLVHGGGAEFDEFGVLLPRKHRASDGGESEEGDEVVFGGVHGKRG
jgi:hypothetical protein